MHVAFGMLGFAAVLAATVLLEQREAAFSGLIYRPALLLLCAGPLFISLISHKLEELAICARSVFKAMRFSVTEGSIKSLPLPRARSTSWCGSSRRWW